MARRRRAIRSSTVRGRGRRPSGPQRRRRARGTSSSLGIYGLAVNTIRRMMIIPSIMSVTPATGSTPGWLNLAQDTLTAIMSVMALSLRDNQVAEEAFDAPSLGSSEIVMSGNAFCMAIGVDELLYASPLSHDRGSIVTPTSFFDGTIRCCAYRQGLVEWVKVRIMPTADASTRSGQICAALVAFTSQSEIYDLIKSKTPEMDFNTIMALPGARVLPADRPFILTWRNTHRVWSEIGGKGSMDSYVGSDPLLRLHFQYSDFAADKSYITSEYSSARATFSMIISSRVRLRSPNMADVENPRSVLTMDNIRFPIRSKILQFNDPKVVVVDGQPVMSQNIVYNSVKKVWTFDRYAQTPIEAGSPG